LGSVLVCLGCVREQEFLVPFKGHRWTKNQIDMRQVNRRKSNVISYVKGIHTDTEIPETVRQDEVYMAF